MNFPVFGQHFERLISSQTRARIIVRIGEFRDYECVEGQSDSALHNTPRHLIGAAGFTPITPYE